MSSILIIGGGFAGFSAAQALRKSGRHQVTLVDRKDYFEITPAQIHQLVAPESLGDSPRFYYKKVLAESFIQGEVVSMESRAAVLASGQRLTFDQVIVATGTRYPKLPLAKPTDHLALGQRRNATVAESAKFKEAKAFLIIGGGVVGVELAGEIASYAPGKSVRLAHRGPRLVENLSPQASEVALEHLQALGVKVELNTATAQPRDGEHLYDATSPVPATDFLASLQPAVLDARGQIQVNDHLQVKGLDHWYAIGDANNAPDGKQASVAMAQGAYVVKQIQGDTKPYKPQPPMALVPLGKTHGFAQLPFGVVKWKFLVNMKRKDFMVGMIRKQLGAE